MKQNKGVIFLITHDAQYSALQKINFKGTGYELFEFADEESAFSALKRYSADLLLFETTASCGSVLSALRKLHCDSSLAKVPLLFIADAADEQGIVHALEAGADDYILKHENFSMTISRIRVHLTIKRLERDLDTQRLRAMNAAKMTALGELAGGAAHEINNPLAMAFGQLHRVTEQIKKIPDEVGLAVKEPLQKLEVSLQRISKIVKAINNFSFVSDTAPMIPTEANSFIEEAVLLCDARFKTGQVVLIMPEKFLSAKVLYRPMDMMHVVYNLLANACDAVSNLDERWVRINLDLTSDKVIVSITDSGSTPTETLAQRIFEPFFTTKPDGKGSGLGLSQAVGLVKANHGLLDLDAKSKHTCFAISLPRLH